MSLPTLHNPIAALTDKHRRIAAAMVYGLDGKVAEKYGLEAGKPLAPQTVADHFRVRRAYVRTLLADPLFKAEMAAQMANKRLGLMPEALERVANIMRSPNEPIALKASETILGETTRNQGVTVNVSQQTALFTAPIKPGYVLRLPVDATAADITQTSPQD